jgi:hypothetical protein
MIHEEDDEYYDDSGNDDYYDHDADEYEGVFKSFRTESITKYTLTKINTR